MKQLIYGAHVIACLLKNFSCKCWFISPITCFKKLMRKIWFGENLILHRDKGKSYLIPVRCNWFVFTFKVSYVRVFPLFCFFFLWFGVGGKWAVQEYWARKWCLPCPQPWSFTFPSEPLTTCIYEWREELIQVRVSSLRILPVRLLGNSFLFADFSFFLSLFFFSAEPGDNWRS